jgi:serine/threonine protein kinase
VLDHGRLIDGRLYLIMSLFDELPLATSIGTERDPGRLVGHLKTTIAVTRALRELHDLRIFHVDLNPMNILYRALGGEPIVRLVDFESSFEGRRHASGAFYDPPTTPGYSAPEISRQPPDARSDVFSAGAVLYTLLTGYGWTWSAEAWNAIDAETGLDPELKAVLLKAAAREPDDRFGSIQEYGGALSAYLERIWPGRGW